MVVPFRWGPGLVDDAPPIEVPRDWRWAVADWPHDRWVAWRRRAAAMLPREPTAEQIRIADRTAYVEITRRKAS